MRRTNMAKWSMSRRRLSCRKHRISCCSNWQKSRRHRPRGVPVTLGEIDGGLAEPSRDDVIAAVRKVLTDIAAATPPPAMSIGNPLTWVWKLLGGG